MPFEALNAYIRGVMNFKPIEEIRSFLEKFADPMGIEIVDVEFDKHTETLTVFIEIEGGVDLDTCEKFHNTINDPIDEFDPSYGQAYTLNVSSPGLDRPFKTPRDFERNLQKEVEVKLFAPLKGKKFLEGILSSYDGNAISLLTEKEEIKISLNKIAKINKAIKFD